MGKFVAGMVIGSGVGAAMGFYGAIRLFLRGKALNGFKDDICDGIERLFFGETRENIYGRRPWRSSCSYNDIMKDLHSKYKWED